VVFKELRLCRGLSVEVIGYLPHFRLV
jgi:hypothetical protein